MTQTHVTGMVTDFSDDPVMMDVTAPKHIQIDISPDSKRVWINVDGICRFRACRIVELSLDLQEPNDGITTKSASDQEVDSRDAQTS